MFSFTPKQAVNNMFQKYDKIEENKNKLELTDFKCTSGVAFESEKLKISL